MGVRGLVVGDSIRVHKIARDIARSWTIGMDGDSHLGGSVWDSFKISVGQGKEFNMGVGGYERQGGKGFIQS